MEQQCLFCNIINGKIPGYKVFEDNKFVAILDINPSNPGHMVLIPKQHMSSIMEMSQEDLANFMMVARGLSLSLLEFGAKGVNFLYGMGEAAGQRTPHMIMHIMPRYENDRVSLVWEPKKFSEDEFKNQQQKLTQLIYKSKALQQPQQIQSQQIQRQPQQIQHQQIQHQQHQQPQMHSQPQQPQQMPQHPQPQQFQVQHQPIARQHQPQQFQQSQQPQQQPQQFQQQPQQQPQQFQQSQQPQQQPQQEDKKKHFRKTGGYWD